MNYILTVIGFLLLIAGNQLKWLYVAGTAFVTTDIIITQYKLIESEMNRLMVSFTGSIIGVMMFYYFNRIITIAVAFLTGGYVMLFLPRLLGWTMTWSPNLLFIIGGSIAAGSTFFWSTFGIILFTTLGGTTLVLQNFSFGNITNQAMALVLVVVGLTAQFILQQYSRPEEDWT
jgi:hypothetical protein